MVLNLRWPAQLIVNRTSLLLQQISRHDIEKSFDYNIIRRIVLLENVVWWIEVTFLKCFLAAYFNVVIQILT